MLPEFYEDRELFITGGSGVVGKALIDKLLRSCNVRKIYLLLRPKRNVSIEDRMEKIKRAMARCRNPLFTMNLRLDLSNKTDQTQILSPTKSERLKAFGILHKYNLIHLLNILKIFRRLLTEKPNEFDDKVVPIPGDAELPMLGITPEYANIMKNVSVVIHSAATVRFDEPLKDAIRLNVGGTHETLKFAETLKHLEVFMHVSTFFSNPYLYRVEPRWYEAPMDWKFCLDLSRRNDIPEEMLDAITRKLIVGFPNTYCFTKNLAESMVNDYRHKLPVVICRPSIVVFAIDDPEPGFPPSLVGAMGMFAVSGAGILKTLYIRNNQRLDLSPQDIAVKSMLYYIMKSSRIFATTPRPEDIPVFNISSCTHSPITFSTYIDIVRDHGFWVDIPLLKNVLIPGVICTDKRLVYMTLVVLKQIIPAVLVDMLLVMCGRKPEVTKVQRKIFNALEIMKPFLFNNYDSPGVSYAEDLRRDLTGTEFQLDTLKVCHKYYSNVEFCHDMVHKVREILFKEDFSTLRLAQIIMKTKIILYRSVQIFLAYKLYNRVVVPMWSNLQSNVMGDSNNNSTLMLTY